MHTTDSEEKDGHGASFSGRSPAKVKFNDRKEHFEYHSRRHYDSPSSGSESSRYSSDSYSSSPESRRRVRSSSRASSRRREVRRHPPDPPQNSRDRQVSSRSHKLHGTHHQTPSSCHRAHAGAGPGGAEYAPQPGLTSPSHPRLTIHPEQGLVCAGSAAQAAAQHHQQQHQQSQAPPQYSGPAALLLHPSSTQRASGPTQQAPAPYPTSRSPANTPTKACMAPCCAHSHPTAVLLPAYTVPQPQPPVQCCANGPALAGMAVPASPPHQHHAANPESPIPQARQPAEAAVPQYVYPTLLQPMQVLSIQGTPVRVGPEGGMSGGVLPAMAHALSAAAGGAPSQCSCAAPYPSAPLEGAPPPVQAHFQLHPPQQVLPVSLPVSLPVPHAVPQQGGDYVQLYDDTTQEVVVADSVLAKELSRQGHALSPLHEAYRAKLAALQAAVNGQLLAKRDALLQQHARLAARAGEVAAKRAALEREVAALADDMARRLRSAESLKQALLGREQAEVGAQLEAVQRLLADIVAASAAGPAEFLSAYRGLADTCDRLVARPFKSEVEVSAEDLPAEAAVYADLASAHAALTQLLGVKDSMIAHLLKERDALQEELQQAVGRYSSELTELEAQCRRYHRRLVALGGAAREEDGDGSESDVVVSSAGGRPPPPPQQQRPQRSRQGADRDRPERGSPASQQRGSPRKQQSRETDGRGSRV